VKVYKERLGEFLQTPLDLRWGKGVGSDFGMTCGVEIRF
jgi:hypothetical protein